MKELSKSLQTTLGDSFYNASWYGFTDRSKKKYPKLKDLGTDNNPGKMLCVILSEPEGGDPKVSEEDIIALPDPPSYKNESYKTEMDELGKKYKKKVYTNKKDIAKDIKETIMKWQPIPKEDLAAQRYYGRIELGFKEKNSIRKSDFHIYTTNTGTVYATNSRTDLENLKWLNKIIKETDEPLYFIQIMNNTESPIVSNPEPRTKTYNGLPVSYTIVAGMKAAKNNEKFYVLRNPRAKLYEKNTGKRYTKISEDVIQKDLINSKARTKPYNGFPVSHTIAAGMKAFKINKKFYVLRNGKAKLYHKITGKKYTKISEDVIQKDLKNSKAQ